MSEANSSEVMERIVEPRANRLLTEALTFVSPDLEALSYNDVTIEWCHLPHGITGCYRPKLHLLNLSYELLMERPEVIATILEHELTHAKSLEAYYHSNGNYKEKPEFIDVVEEELGAYTAEVNLWKRLYPNGFHSEEPTELEDLLGWLVVTEASGNLRKWVVNNLLMARTLGLI